ncbi:aldo/keto reductase [Telluribacter sp.]|jgi:aryl-alcohol dehydrogenase-like predicted oxidoreductase|uniref:aldo/keto reductase n=1 Tax=Telluribacter sp. TaxID=1978767 RepID=UPI002E0DF375|nr:aldo/keto reductase [Telluribacter sp.]
MRYRRLGKTDFRVSEISLGTWQVGGKWGETFSHERADGILNAAVDAGINFIDTADVYGNGESEKAVGRLVRNRSEQLYVATKCGRQLNPHVNEAYRPGVLRKFVEDSLQNMNLERLDLIQLHCPPTEVYYRPEIFELFDRLKQEGKIQHLGVSVEKVEEALKAIEFPNVTTVQIIFNMFRQRPAELFFSEASQRDVGIIVRVPLASGLLTGKFDEQSTFKEGDHRHFNRHGEAFDKGETFSGIDYQTGVDAVKELKEIFSAYENLAPVALRWILDFQEVSCIIPGASRPEQVVSNLHAQELPPLATTELEAIKDLYERTIKGQVHHLW